MSDNDMITGGLKKLDKNYKIAKYVSVGSKKFSGNFSLNLWKVFRKSVEFQN